MKKLLLAALLLTGCAEKIIPKSSTVTKSDSTVEKQVKQQVEIKGSKVSELDVNKLMQQMIAQQKSQTIAGQPPQVVVRTIKDSNGVELQFMLDAMGRFQADCSKKDSMLAYYAKQTEYWHREATKEVVAIKPSFVEGMWSDAKTGFIWIAVVIVALVVLRLFVFRG